MAEKPKKKNISPFLADVRHPRRIIRDERNHFYFSEKKDKKETPFKLNIKIAKSTPKKRLIFLFGGLAIVVLLLMILSYSFLPLILRNATGQLEKSSFWEASDFQVNEKDSQNISINQFFTVLQSMPEILAWAQNMNKISIEIFSAFVELRTKGFLWLFEDGQSLLSLMAETEKKLTTLTSQIENIEGLATEDALLGIRADYHILKERLIISREFLSGLNALLADESRVLIFLENGSEIRPAGGFIGSYAEVEISRGQIKNIEVSDIMEPDRSLDSAVIPPKPLQLITKSWEARDANWFFDFPTSARKVIDFIEASSFYKDKNIQFAGAIALNHRVIGDILKITGPINLPSYDLKLDENNFLSEIQKEVSTDAYLRGSERKQILSELTEPLIEAIKQLDDKKQRELYDLMAARVAEKDIRFYFKDSRLQNFFVRFGGSGSIYPLADDFSGDYLAVVNANIGSGKNDIFIKQRIILNSQLMANGSLINRLQIIRHHFGNEATEPYYRTVNENYLRILTPMNNELLSVTGMTERLIKPPINYIKADFQRDPDVDLLEKGEESNRQVFANWLNVEPGETGTLELYYRRPNVLSGNNFQFIYEKQSGVDTELEYYLEAPEGYVFVESGTRNFIYKTKNAPARLIINLTLRKN